VSARTVPKRFAVAFSLAGEQRSLVLPIAQEVEAVLGRSAVFYDDWYEHWIAGGDADLLLGEVYGERSELVVVCVSAQYDQRPWTVVEHRSVRARLMRSRPGADRHRVLPIRVGDGDVKGVLFNEIVPDVRRRTATEAAELILSRLNLVRGLVEKPDVAPPSWPHRPPELHWPMADHWEPRTAFAALLCAESPFRALVVRGASETGKSHMSRQMLRNATSLTGVRCARLDLKGTTNMDVEVEAFSWPLDVEPPSGGSLTERLSRIFTVLRGRARPTILLFDSYEAAGEVREWVEKVLLPHLGSASWLRVVVTGQSVPDRFGTAWEAFAAPLVSLTTPAAEHWYEYGRINRGEAIDLGFVTQACELADGRPSVLASLFGPRV
jgi:hypothetical protein